MCARKSAGRICRAFEFQSLGWLRTWEMFDELLDLEEDAEELA